MHSPWKSTLLAVALLGASLQIAQAQVVVENYPNAPVVFNGGILANAKLGPNNSSAGNYNAISYFNVGGKDWSVSLLPLHPTDQPNPTANWTNILNGQSATVTTPAGPKNYTYGQLYDFPTANGVPVDYTLSNGALNVRTYATFANIPNDLFGIDFHVQYNPTVPPDSPSAPNIHWIQTLNDNWNLSGAPGTLDKKVDVPAGQADPYYDTQGVADSTFLFDEPRRNISGLAGYSGPPIVFNFETFLVKEVAVPTYNPDGTINTKGKVQVYDGVNYGFIAQTPEPGSVALFITLTGSGLVIFRKRRRAA